jgi:hypothetical protein
MISNEELPALVGRLIRTTRRYGKTQEVQEGVLILCFAAVALARGHEMPDDFLEEIFQHAMERTAMIGPDAEKTKIKC